MRVRIIDIESAADLPEKAVCEIGWADVVSTSTDLAGAPSTWTVVPGDSVYINPGRPIDPVTSSIHHIVDEDVRFAPAFGDIVRDIVDNRLLDLDEEPIAALAAHSAEFEREFFDDLNLHLDWICTYRCALRLYDDLDSYSNQALRYILKPKGLDRDLAHPTHRAGPDAYVTAFHLRDMLNTEGVSVEDLIKWSGEPALLPRCKIGKWRNGGKGTRWTEVDDGFLTWLLDKDFSEDVLHTARYHLDLREKEAREEQERFEREHAETEATMRDPFPESVDGGLL